MNRLNYRNLIIEISTIVIGNFFLAIGSGVFVIPNEILTGGVAGIAVALYPIFHIDPGIMTNILMIVLFIIGACFLGKEFIIKTALSTVLYPLFLSIILYYTKIYDFQFEPIIASIYSGVFMGIGVGLVFRTNASTGGMDIPPLIIHKYTHINLSVLVMITDALTVLIGIYSYGLKAALIGLISVWISSIMIEKALMLGDVGAKQVMIISEKYKILNQIILDELGRGTTIMSARGGYSNHTFPVVMVVVSKKQYPKLHKIVTQVDSKAFMITSNVFEVTGLGFSYDE